MKTWLLGLLAFIPFLATAQTTFTDWSAITPMGNEMNNYNGKTLVLQNGQKLPDLKRWYFYRGHIVGELDKGKGFFVVNENTRRIDTFERQNAWRQEIEREQLKPKYITRWYTSSWVLFGHPDTFYFGLVAIPIYLFFMLIVFLFAFFKARFRFSHPFTQILAFMIAITLLVYIYDTFPISF